MDDIQISESGNKIRGWLMDAESIENESTFCVERDIPNRPDGKFFYRPSIDVSLCTAHDRRFYISLDLDVCASDEGDYDASVARLLRFANRLEFIAAKVREFSAEFEWQGGSQK